MLAQGEVTSNQPTAEHFYSHETDSPLFLPNTPPISPFSLTSSKTTPPRPKLTIITDPNPPTSVQDRPRLGTAPAPWERRLSQRQKQLDYGYNTIGYHNYVTQIPKAQRGHGDPQTPDKNQRCSTRSWMGQIKRWRRKLHLWDNLENGNPVYGLLVSDQSTSDSKSWDSYSSIDSEKASLAASEWLDQVSDSEASQPEEFVKPLKMPQVEDDIYRFTSLTHYEQEHFGKS